MTAETTDRRDGERGFTLIETIVALALMVLVTAWNAYMAWVQDSELLAAYALAALSCGLALNLRGYGSDNGEQQTVRTTQRI